MIKFLRKNVSSKFAKIVYYNIPVREATYAFDIARVLRVLDVPIFAKEKQAFMIPSQLRQKIDYHSYFFNGPLSQDIADSLTNVGKESLISYDLLIDRLVTVYEYVYGQWWDWVGSEYSRNCWSRKSSVENMLERKCEFMEAHPGRKQVMIHLYHETRLLNKWFKKLFHLITEKELSLNSSEFNWHILEGIFFLDHEYHSSSVSMDSDFYGDNNNNDIKETSVETHFERKGHYYLQWKKYLYTKEKQSTNAYCSVDGTIKTFLDFCKVFEMPSESNECMHFDIRTKAGKIVELIGDLKKLAVANKDKLEMHQQNISICLEALKKFFNIPQPITSDWLENCYKDHVKSSDNFKPSEDIILKINTLKDALNA